jgi:hypothetical protein
VLSPIFAYRLNEGAMLRGIAVAATAALLLSSAVFAQQPNFEHHEEGRPPAGGQPHGNPQFVPHGPPQGGMGGGPPPGANFQRPGPPPNGFVNHPPSGVVVVPQGGPPPGPPPGGPPPGQHFGGPAGPAGAGQFTYHGHPFHQVHVAPFFFPPGYGYRHWVVGAILPPVFLAPNYYYEDWSELGLDQPAPGTEWVRYGSDLLLVDVTSGQVIDAIYDVFD